MKWGALFILIIGIFLIAASLYYLLNYYIELWVGVALGIVILMGLINIVIGIKLIRRKK